MKEFTRGLPIGLVLGCALTLILWKVVLAGRFDGADPAGGAQGAAGRPAAADDAESREAAALREERARLQAEAKSLAAALASAKPGAGGGSAETGTGGGGAAGPVLGSRKDKNPWNELGLKLYEMRDKLNNDGDGMEDPELQALWMEAIEIARKLAEEMGIDMQEFEMSPYTLPMIMLAMLDASDTPPDAAQSAVLDAMVETMEGEWKAFAEGKEGLSRLESRLGMIRMSGAMFDSLWGTMTPEQKAIFDKADMFARDKWGRPNRQSSGTRENVSQTILGGWAGELGLSEAQKTAVKPVVDDYMRQYDALQADFARREASGEAVGPTEKALATTRLMVETQKRLGETVTLDEKQQKKFKDWDGIYGFEIEGE